MERSADEAVEAAAEAMRAAYGKHTNDGIVPWASAGLPQKTAWRVCARAAIAAFRPYHFEEAAKLCDAERESFLSPEYATDQPLSSIRERFAAGSCAAAIRAAK